MNFQDLLAKYPRIAIAGAPRTGKTTFTNQVSDRQVIHTDDWMDWPWREVPALVAAACKDLDSFVLEGVRAPDALRDGGVEVDAVLWLSRPKVQQTPAQRSMGVGVHTVLSQWAEKVPDVPIVTEDQLTLTLDHGDLPQKTRRFSVFTLDASKIQRTPQGGLRIPARVSKAGVFAYKRGERVLREYRPASELRKPAALASLKGAPVVVLHPSINGGTVDTRNAKQLTVGHFEDPAWNEDTQAIEGFVVTNDADTIRRIERGELADISSGYENGRDFTPGFTASREPYDLVQTDYVFNHVALGPPGWGRQGQDVGLTLDANDNQVIAALPPTSEESSMDPNKDKDGKSTQAPTTSKTKDAADGQAVPTAATPPAQAEAKTADEVALTPDEVAGLKAIAKMLPGLNKLLNTGSPDSAPAASAPGVPRSTDSATTEEKKTLDSADIERIAQEGVEVRTEAMTVLGASYNPKGKSTRQVRLDVIRTFDSAFQGDGKSDEAIGAAYGIAVHAGLERKKNADELAKTRRTGTRTMDEADAAPRKPIAHQAYEAWKDPAPAKN